MSTCVAVLRSGDECGIAAIGRCTRCERPYCPSHIDPDRLVYAVCGRCQADATQRQEAETERGLEQLRAVRVNFNSLFDKIRRQIGTQGQVERQIQVGERKVLLRGYVPTYRTLPAAWPIGLVKWLVVESSPDGAQTKTQAVETGITSAGELVPMRPPTSYGLRGSTTSHVDPDLAMTYRGLLQLARENGIALPPSAT